MTHQLHEFSELRQKDIFCDAVIRVDDGTEFSVHRVILSACSDYFLALFRNSNDKVHKPIRNNNRSRSAKNSANASTGNYKIAGINGPAMTLALDYIYDAKCHIDCSNMLELLVVGDYLGVLGLVKYCEDFIISAISTENCVILMRFGKHRTYPPIYEAAKLFILSDFVHIMTARRGVMLDLSADQFEELIRDDRLRVKQEDLVWESCLAWLGNGPDRRQFLVPLMMSCRLALITPQVLVNWSLGSLNHLSFAYLTPIPQYFNERVREHPYVRESEPAKAIINDVLKLRAGFEDITTIHVSRPGT